MPVLHTDEWTGFALFRFLSPDLAAELARLSLLRPFLRKRLMVAVAAQDTTPLTPEERQLALQAFAHEHGLRDGAALEVYRQQQLLDATELEALIELPLRLRRHCERQFGAKAEARFLERKTQLDRVVYSLLRLTDAGLARELYLQIAEGESNFADLAAVHAQGPEKATRGIVGPVSLTKAHPVLADRLRTASPGALLEPFPVENWWIVVRLESLTPAVFDAPTATQMAEELFEQWLSEQEERQLGELRALLPTAAAALGPTAAATP